MSNNYLAELDRLAEIGRRLAHVAGVYRTALVAAGPSPNPKDGEAPAVLFGTIAELIAGMVERLEEGAAKLPTPELPPGFCDPFRPSSN